MGQLLGTTVVFDAVVGIWIAFVAFIGVFILSFFGSTETLSAEDKAILVAARAIIEHAKENPIDVLTDAAAGLMSALVDVPEDIPDVPKDDVYVADLAETDGPVDAPVE